MSDRQDQDRARPFLRAIYRTEKGQEGMVEYDLSDQFTLDGADVEYQMAKANKELRRIESARTFTKESLRGALG